MPGRKIKDLIVGPIVPVTEASRDKTNKVSLVTSSLNVFNFDDVKEAYIRNWALAETPKSVDALHFDKSGKVFFIEFKNCKISKSGYEIRRKIFDSMILFEDMVPNGLSFARSNCEFILVYNEQKNLEPAEDQAPERTIDESESLTEIAKGFHELGGDEFIRFNLEYFQGYCFHGVHTYTEKEFQDRFLHDAESILK